MHKNIQKYAKQTEKKLYKLNSNIFFFLNNRLGINITILVLILQI